MRTKWIRFVLPAAALAALFGAAACGSVATPEWAAEAQGTQAAMASTNEHLTAIAPTHTPTNTAVPPTATSTPLPSATIAPTNTEPPAATPTTEATAVPPTEAPTEAAAGAAGDAANGQTIFNTPHTLPDGVSWACASCHSIDPSQPVMIGPGLWNVSVHGVEHQNDPNLTPEEYIRNSIINPQDVIAPHPQGAQWPLSMPQGFGEVLTEQEINDLVAYLMTLHD
jgi:mono/diheme cytochrome c family protein